jgi:hypothetical protein
MWEIFVAPIIRCDLIISLFKIIVLDGWWYGRLGSPRNVLRYSHIS